jgi:hypothetical protein
VDTGTDQTITLEGNSLSEAEISRDGRYITYNRRLRGLSAALYRDELLRYDLVTASNLFVHILPSEGGFPGAGLHTMSSDGSLVAYEFFSNNAYNIYLRDFGANTNYLVSTRADGSLSSGTLPVLSPDDTKLFFISPQQVI